MSHPTVTSLLEETIAVSPEFIEYCGKWKKNVYFCGSVQPQSRNIGGECCKKLLLEANLNNIWPFTLSLFTLYSVCLLAPLPLSSVSPWTSADFIPGGRGQKTYFLLKKYLKNTFSFIKVEKILFWPAKKGQVPPLALRCGRPCVSHIIWPTLFIKNLKKKRHHGIRDKIFIKHS
jgi:hypothetical protein